MVLFGLHGDLIRKKHKGSSGPWYSMTSTLVVGTSHPTQFGGTTSGGWPNDGGQMLTDQPDGDRLPWHEAGHAVGVPPSS